METFSKEELELIKKIAFNLMRNSAVPQGETLKTLVTSDQAYDMYQKLQQYFCGE